MRSTLLVAVALASTAIFLSAVAAPVVQWQPLTSGVALRLRGIGAVSADQAWASGERGTVLRTLDGGRSWQPRPVTGAEALDFRDIEAIDARTAVVMSAAPGEGSRIYRTTDGGETWTLRYTATDPGMFLDAMAFSDASHGCGPADAGIPSAALRLPLDTARVDHAGPGVARGASRSAASSPRSPQAA